MRSIVALAAEMLRELIRKKDFYVLFILMLAFMGFLAAQSFFNVEGITRYIRDLGYSFVTFFPFIIAVAFTAKQLPTEINNRTIYPLLAKPITRQTVILGKFCGGVLVSVFSFLLFFTVYVLFYMSGGGSLDSALLLQVFLMGGFMLCLVCAMVMFFSNFLTISANVTLSLLVYIIVNGFSGMFQETVISAKGLSAWFFTVIYYIIPHFEFYDMRIRLVHGWGTLPPWVIGCVGLYTLFYCGALLYLSGALFDRRRL